MISVYSHKQPFQQSSWNEKGSLNAVIFSWLDITEILNINLTRPYVHETCHVKTQRCVTSGPDALCLENVSKHVAWKLCNVVGGQRGEAAKSLAPNPLLRVPWMFWRAQGSTFSGSTL